MSYTFTQAIAGKGAQLSIGPVAGTSSPTYTPVFELTSIPFSGPKWDLVDVTNFNSGGLNETIQTIQKWPALTLGGNYIQLDPGQMAIAAAQVAGGLYMFELVYPLTGSQTTTGKTVKFNAYVMDYGTELTPTGEQKLTCELQPSGAFTTVAGS